MSCCTVMLSTVCMLSVLCIELGKIMVFRGNDRRSSTHSHCPCHVRLWCLLAIVWESEAEAKPVISFMAIYIYLYIDSNRKSDCWSLREPGWVHSNYLPKYFIDVLLFSSVKDWSGNLLVIKCQTSCLHIIPYWLMDRVIWRRDASILPFILHFRSLVL